MIGRARTHVGSDRGCLKPDDPPVAIQAQGISDRSVGAGGRRPAHGETHAGVLVCDDAAARAFETPRHLRA